MILVDIEVQSVGRKYNFTLEEQVPISVLISEIQEVICQKESCFLGRAENELTLSSLENGVIMSPELSLSEYGVVNGHTLLLT